MTPYLRSSAPWFCRVCFAGVLLALSGCSAVAPSQPEGSNLEIAESRPFVRTVNDLAWPAYREASANAKGSVFISPYGFSVVLAVLTTGAGGRTERELRRVARLAVDDARLARAHQVLRRAVLGKGRGIRVETDTPLIAAADLDPLTEWARMVRRYYAAEVQKGVLAPGIKFEIVNRVAFKGEWTRPFDTRATKEGLFEGERSTTAKFMHGGGLFRYARLDGVKVLELPYGRQGRSSMLIVLPDSGTELSDVEAGLDSTKLADWLSCLEKREMYVVLPRFRIENEVDFTALLKRMGATSAFDPNTANFSRMAGPRPCYLVEVRQRAAIDVDETGTRAAAETRAPVAAAPEEEFMATRPFLFLIMHRPTSCLLFLGRVVDPQ